MSASANPDLRAQLVLDDPAQEMIVLATAAATERRARANATPATLDPTAHRLHASLTAASTAIAARNKGQIKEVQ